IRPEHLEACDAEVADFILTVEIVEPLGADTLLYGKMAGNANLIIAEQPGKRHYRRGETVALRMDRERVHLFDKQTQQRIDHDR
ncbi:MAG: TOBE domain-containing protein, partial [Natronospirillum sp.]